MIYTETHLFFFSNPLRRERGLAQNIIYFLYRYILWFTLLGISQCYYNIITITTLHCSFPFDEFSMLVVSILKPARLPVHKEVPHQRVLSTFDVDVRRLDDGIG